MDTFQCERSPFYNGYHLLTPTMVKYTDTQHLNLIKANYFHISMLFAYKQQQTKLYRYRSCFSVSLYMTPSTRVSLEAYIKHIFIRSFNIRLAQQKEQTLDFCFQIPFCGVKQLIFGNRVLRSKILGGGFVKPKSMICFVFEPVYSTCYMN